MPITVDKTHLIFSPNGRVLDMRIETPFPPGATIRITDLPTVGAVKLQNGTSLAVNDLITATQLSTLQFDTLTSGGGKSEFKYEVTFDGETQIGSVLVEVQRDVNNPQNLQVLNPTQFAVLNGETYFTAETPTHGAELWKMDTSGNLTRVSDVFPGTGGGLSNPASIIFEHAGTVFFTAQDGPFGAAGTKGVELYKVNADGSVSLVADYRPGFASSNPGLGSGVVKFGDWAFFDANGTRVIDASGTVGTIGSVFSSLAGIAPRWKSLVVDGDKMMFFFRQGDEEKVAALDASGNVSLIATIGDDEHAGTMVQKFGTGVLVMTEAYGSHYLTFVDANAVATRLPVFLGSEGYSASLEDYYQRIVEFNGSFYFVARGPITPAGSFGYELHKVDQAGNVTLITDLNPGVASGLARGTKLYVHDNALYFTANDGSGSSVWRLTASGTMEKVPSGWPSGLDRFPSPQPDPIFKLVDPSSFAINGTDGDDTLIGNPADQAIYAGDGDDYVEDGAGNDRVILGDGDDEVRVGGGYDSFQGGAGNDMISYYDSLAGVHVNLATNYLTGGKAGGDTISGFEGVAGSNLSGDTLYGTDGNNTIFGHGGNDKVYDLGGDDLVQLGDGDDYVRVGGGYDSFDGGAGVDYISYYDSLAGIRVDLLNNTATGGKAGGDTISGFESISGSLLSGDTIWGTEGDNVIRTYGGNDSVYDRGGDDLVELGSGNDYVRVGGGYDTFVGGSGTDYISYYDSLAGIRVDLLNNTATGGKAGGDTISGFESISGSLLSGDTIWGTEGDNVIRTYGGNDSVYDRGGDDLVELGSGDDYVRVGGGYDTFVGGSGTDYISYYDSLAGIRVDLLNNTATGGKAGGDTISGFESISGSLLSGDTIWGTEGDNVIRTYGGNDSVYDRGGDDLVELGSGDDYVRVGGGYDTFFGGSGTDYISYYDSLAGVRVNLETNAATGGKAGGDTISGFESISGSNLSGDVLYGTSGANTLRGNGGNDSLYGGSGTDKIYGGSGNDYVRVGGGAESFYGGSGTDYISYYDSSNGITIDLQSNSVSGSWAVNDVISSFESASGSRTGADKMYGTSGANTLRGNGGNDSLWGRSGDDKLYGGSGNDRFDGGGGADSLYGGSGSDIFHFDRGEGADIVKDFQNNVDTIEFDNFSGLTDAASALAFATESGGDVFFDFGTDGTLLVENTTKAQLMNDIDIV